MKMFHFKCSQEIVKKRTEMKFLILFLELMQWVHIQKSRVYTADKEVYTKQDARFAPGCFSPSIDWQ